MPFRLNIYTVCLILLVGLTKPLSAEVYFHWGLKEHLDTMKANGGIITVQKWLEWKKNSPGVGLYGDGLYVSGNPYDSSDYAFKSGGEFDVMAVEIDPNQGVTVDRATANDDVDWYVIRNPHGHPDHIRVRDILPDEINLDEMKRKLPETLTSAQKETLSLHLGCLKYGFQSGCCTIL